MDLGVVVVVVVVVVTGGLIVLETPSGRIRSPQCTNSALLHSPYWSLNKRSAVNLHAQICGGELPMEQL